MFFDTHNHSQFSFDGQKTSVEDSVKASIEKGLGGLCFTDHCDFYVPDIQEKSGKKVPEVFDVRAQQAEIDRVAGKVAETIGKAADKALDQAQKVIDKTDKSANSASDQVGKVVDGIGKAAEKAANAFTSFLENLTRNDSDKK